MHLDTFLPDCHFREYHQTRVSAPPVRAFEAVRAMDLSGSAPIRLLLRLRALPMRLSGRDDEHDPSLATLDGFLKAGFVMLALDPPREAVLGAVGRFWKPAPDMVSVRPGEFSAFQAPGYAKVAFNLAVQEINETSCRVSTETRIQCLGPVAFSFFTFYWALIRPFSGLIRMEMLKIIKASAEKKGSH